MPVNRSFQANQKGGSAPAAGTVRVAPAADAADIFNGDQDYDGSGKGGTQREGTQFYDGQAPTFRKINNADPTAKNTSF